MIAQEVQQQFPELVSASSDMLAVSYTKLGVIAIKAIQEQQILIDSQNDRIEKQDQILAQIVNKLNAIENSKP